MGKKETKDQFNNPFDALKGLSVSGTKPAPAAAKTQPPAPVAPKAAPEPEPSFDEAMQQLGVRRIEAGDEPLQPVRSTGIAPIDEAAAMAVSTAPRAGRRLKQVQRGQLHPEAELDLHGMTVAQALPKVGWFIENAIFHGCEVVRIVTGRGKSSANEVAVLKPQVEALLNGPLKAQVLEWDEAPKPQGGVGALIVVLRLPEMEE